MTILLLAEHDNSSLNDQTAKAITAAAQIGGEVHVLVAGSNVMAIADAAAGISGVSKVLVAEDSGLAHNLAEPLADLIVSLAGNYDTIIAPATASAKNVLPRVAALLDVMQVSEIVEVVSADTFKRPIYAGNAIQTVRSSDPKKVITVRTASFSPAANGPLAAVEKISTAALSSGLSAHVSDELSTSDRPELTSAKIVISGGRALGSAEKFNEVSSVADKLGAAVGASRAAVDAGYAPNDCQSVRLAKWSPRSSTSPAVSPALSSISRDEGLQGYRASTRTRKPNFPVADYGLVGDLFEVLPELLSPSENLHIARSPSWHTSFSLELATWASQC